MTWEERKYDWRIAGSWLVAWISRYVLGDIETDPILFLLLFSLYTEELILKIKQMGFGMEVGGERLCILLCVDDVLSVKAA